MTLDHATILVADDSEDDVALFETAFTKVCPNTTRRFVSDGEKAISYLDGQGQFANRTAFPVPHLLILDLKMPGKNGYEVLKWIKSAGMSKVPVVVLSGSDLKGDRTTSLNLGAAEFHTKPLNVHMMEAMIRGICERFFPAAPAEARA